VVRGGERFIDFVNYLPPRPVSSGPSPETPHLSLIVAATHHYFTNLHTLKQVLSAVLAVVLWPLLLIGINLHVH